MNRVRLFSASKRVYALPLACGLLLILATASHPTVAQRKVDPQQPAQAKSDVGYHNNSETSASDNNYTEKIKEYTTEAYFLTELVDHLPMSDQVPSPDKVLGYIAGAPNKLTYSKDLYRYYRQLAKTTPRVRVFSAPERSEEGKEQILAVVGDEVSLAKLDRYKEITAKLADPRRINEPEAQNLISEGKLFYWASG